MAVMELMKSATRTFATPKEPASFTSPCPQSFDYPNGGRPASPPDSPRHNRTGAMVEHDELGNEGLSNEATPDDSQRNKPHHEPADDPIGARLRSELARRLLYRFDQLLPLVGAPSLAANVRLLKRDLASVHDQLKAYPSEGNFLSLITLVESTIAQRKWKEYSTDLLRQLQLAVDIGYRKPHVRFEDYDMVRRQFLASQVATGPRIDLETLDWDDIEDGEEGQTTNLP
jgi:hypothetical protein